GIEVKQGGGKITLSQSAYAKKILENANMKNYNSCDTPMVCRLKLNKLKGGDVVDPTGYRSLIRSLSDSDYAGDVKDRRSTSGAVYFLDKSLVTWSSQKQKIVALSSCEAEYVAAVAACQGIWLSRLISDMMGMKEATVKLLMDNMSAIALSKNPVHHGRSKHIDTKYHFLRECIEDGNVEVDHIGTAEQLADIFTKSLGRVKFIELRSALGIVDVHQA
ncbi:hypothetical protein M3S_E11, partial [Sorghum bicolor]